MERMKLEAARIVEGIVEIQQGGKWLPAADAIPLSNAVADSEGQILIGDDIALYIVNTQPDLQQLFDAVEALAAQVSALAITPVAPPVSPVPLNPIVAEAVDEIKDAVSEYELK